MDQDKTLNQPKFAAQYKDVEARRAYMRKYQLDRYYRQKALQNVETEGVVENKQMIPAVVNAGAAPVDQFQNALHSLTETLGPEDGVSKFIKKVEPFVPLAMSFIQGFVQNMNAKREEQSKEQTPQGPRPPDGWLVMDAISKLKRKYNADGSLSQWYLAGEYYDQQIAIGGIGAGVQSGQPVVMERTYQGEHEAALWRRQQQMIQHERSMSDLQREAQVFDKKVPEVKESVIIEEKKEELSGDQAKQIVQDIAPKLQEDAIKYLNLVINYFKTRPLDQFEEDLKNIDKTLIQYKDFIDLLPFQAKESFKRISSEEIEKMIEESDPEKHKMILKKKLKGKLFKLWEELKAKL